MQIEVGRGDGETQIYYFDNDKKVMVGRMSNADIRLVGEGVSREHLQIYYRNGKVYILDMESTNGAYIDDKRIPPGTEVEFTSFFQVKIGKDFFLSLLAHEKPEVEKIQTPSREELTQKSTKSFQEYKAKTKPRRPPPAKVAAKKSPVSKLSVNVVFGLLILAGAIWFQVNKEDTIETDLTPVAPAIENRQALDAKLNAFLAQKNKELLDPLVREKKCLTEMEQKYCQSFGRPLIKGEGALVGSNSVVIFIDFSQNKGQYQKYLEKVNDEQSLLYLESLNESRLLLTKQFKLRDLIVVNVKNDIGFEFLHFTNIAAINIFTAKTLIEDIFHKGNLGRFEELKQSYPVK